MVSGEELESFENLQKIWVREEERLLVATVKLFAHFAHFAFVELLFAEATFPHRILHLTTSVRVQQLVVSATHLVPEKEHTVGVVGFQLVVTPQLIGEIDDLT